MTAPTPAEIDQIIQTESSPGLYWLSFVDPDKSDPPGEQQPGGPGFLGVAIIRARGPVSAARRAHVLGLNPGGQIEIFGPAPEGTWPNGLVERPSLLTAQEAMALP